MNESTISFQTKGYIASIFQSSQKLTQVWLCEHRSSCVDVVICFDHRILFPIVTWPRRCRSIHPSGPNASSPTHADQTTSTYQLAPFQVAWSPDQILPPYQGEQRTRARSCFEHPTLEDVSMTGGSPRGPHSFYLTFDTCPVTVPINSRLRPPTAASRHIATRSNRGYPCWCRRCTALMSLVLSQGHVTSVHWTNSTYSLRPTHPLGVLDSRPSWVTRAPRHARDAYK